MNLLFWLWLLILFVGLFLIFFRMSQTNKEEWLYTEYIRGSLIGAILGFLFGGLTGYVFFKLTGLWLGLAYGLLIGSVAFAINLFLFNYRTKKEAKLNNKKSPNKFK